MKIIKSKPNPLVDMIGLIIEQQEQVLTLEEKSKNPFFKRMINAVTEVYQANKIPLNTFELTEIKTNKYYCKVNDDFFTIDISTPETAKESAPRFSAKSVLATILVAIMLTSCAGHKTLTGKQQVKKDQKERMFKGW